MARIELPDGLVLYDSYEDLRGNPIHKNIEKTQGPNAIITMAGGKKWRVNRCPMCECLKSFDPDIRNNVLYGCDGECPCHD